METIKTLDDFIDAVDEISEQRADWIVKAFMDKLNNRIVKAIRNNEVVHSDVLTAWFHLYSQLNSQAASRERIRSTARSIYKWLLN